MNPEFEQIFALASKLIRSGGQREDVLTALCHLLKQEVGHYDWVGFYMADPANREAQKIKTQLELR